MNPPSPRPLVYVVDDDAAVRDSAELLCETAGFEVRTFASAEDFLAGLRTPPQCVLLDVRMPGMSGLDLQVEMRRRGIVCPIVFLTAYGDIPTTVRAMKHGASDFLCKPVDGAVLVDTIREACGAGAPAATEATHATDIPQLTPREMQIMALVIDGRSSKQIGRMLGISFRTVDIHRSRIMHKTGAANVLELARLAPRLASAAAAAEDKRRNTRRGTSGTG